MLAKRKVLVLSSGDSGREEPMLAEKNTSQLKIDNNVGLRSKKTKIGFQELKNCQQTLLASQNITLAIFLY